MRIKVRHGDSEEMLPTAAEFALAAYPVGALYMSSDPTSPETLFGGKWRQISDVFILAAGKRAAGVTGGEETHTLTVAEMPAHSHTISVNRYGNPDGWRDYGRNYWNENWDSSEPSVSSTGGGRRTTTCRPSW